MDKIIILIIIFYVISKFFSHLGFGEDGENKKTTRHPSIPPLRSVPFPSSKAETGSAPHPDFPTTWREVGHVLRDLKRQAEGQQEGIDSSQVPPHREGSVNQHTKKKKDDQKDRAYIQKQMLQKGLIEEMIPLAKAKIIQEDKIEGDYISFDQPGVFLQGIILSEILRPPISRRNHLLPPYLRG